MKRLPKNIGKYTLCTISKCLNIKQCSTFYVQTKLKPEDIAVTLSMHDNLLHSFISPFIFYFKTNGLSIVINLILFFCFFCEIYNGEGYLKK